VYENNINKFSDKADALNFLAMKVWFLIDPPIPATIQVESLENLTWLLLLLIQDSVIQVEQVITDDQSSSNGLGLPHSGVQAM
jgi:hypothetical protein